MDRHDPFRSYPFVTQQGYSNQGRFYLIPQGYQGGIDPKALASHAIYQLRLQDWIANPIKAKKALMPLGTFESGALTNGFARSRYRDRPRSRGGEIAYAEFRGIAKTAGRWAVGLAAFAISLPIDRAGILAGPK